MAWMSEDNDSLFGLLWTLHRFLVLYIGSQRSMRPFADSQSVAARRVLGQIFVNSPVG